MTSTPVPIQRRKIRYYNDSVYSDTGWITQTYGFAFRESNRSAPLSGSFTKNVFKVTSMSALSSEQQAASEGFFAERYGTPPWTFVVLWRGPFSSTCSSFGSYPAIASGDFLTQGDIALTAAFAKLGKPKYELGVELGELKETLQFLRSPLSTLRSFLTRDRSSNLRKLRWVLKNKRDSGRIYPSTGKTVADTWLELRYALRPLIGSIQNALELSLKARRIDPSRIRTVGKKLTTSLTKSLKETGAGAIYNLQMVSDVKTTARATIRAKVYYRQISEASTSRKLGVSLVNIPEIAWELTRCSFIADWFVNLGDYIASFRITPELQILGSTVSYRLSLEHSKEITSCDPVSGATFSELDLGGKTTATTQSYDRVVTGKFPPGLPHWRSNPSLDLPKMVDLLLIILQGISLRK